MARGPSAETIAAAYAADFKVKSLTEKWEQEDAERRAKAKVRLQAALAERAPLMKQRQSIRQKIAGLSATIDIERQNAKAHKMPAALRNQIGRRKSEIFMRVRKEFLREQRIQFDQLVKKT